MPLRPAIAMTDGGRGSCGQLMFSPLGGGFATHFCCVPASVKYLQNTLVSGQGSLGPAPLGGLARLPGTLFPPSVREGGKSSTIGW
jgi:hypothetical protein